MAKLTSRSLWAALFIVFYAILLVISWNILKSILNWYEISSPATLTSSSAAPYSPSSLPRGYRALCASVAVGAVAGLLTAAAVLSVAFPAALVGWITVVVLLSFSGKSRRALVTEGQKLTAEITVFVAKMLVQEGKIVAAVCAVLGYFALFRRINQTGEG